MFLVYFWILIQYILDAPLRVNGKLNGTVNGEKLLNLDLQSYIVMSDGRAYTAISKIPVSIGASIQSLQILGGVIGWVFAKPVAEALNGYQLTGGVFNHSATLYFPNTNQKITIKHKYNGLDVFDQLRLEVDIQGEIPQLLLSQANPQVTVNEYEEQYTLTSPGVIQSSTSRSFSYRSLEGNENIITYTVDQVFVFDYCKFEASPADGTWRIKVGKNFISYESREQIVRFGLSSKVTPLGGK